MIKSVGLTLISLVLLCSCTKKEVPLDPAKMSVDQLKSRGQQVYMANCTSCHNPNPKLDGSVGPSVAGSNLELIKARVIGKTYPPGYKPKRSTGVMPAFPHLEPEVEALAAFLSDFKQNGS